MYVVFCKVMCRSVPGPDRLVEALGSHEHALHICHGRSVPGPDRLVEFDGPPEHGLHDCCSFESAPNLASQEGIGLRGTPRKAWKKPAGCVSCDEDR